jgi:hypothetical protein
VSIIRKSLVKGTTETPTMKMVRYFSRILVSLSVLLNVLLGGSLNQTFSARNWQWKKDKKPNLVWFIDAIFGKDHCSECWVWWKTRRQW